MPVPEPAAAARSEVQVAQAIRSLRLRGGLSQRQLALRMGVPRTYVSKIENEKATPTLSSLARLADGAGGQRARPAARLRSVARQTRSTS